MIQRHPNLTPLTRADAEWMMEAARAAVRDEDAASEAVAAALAAMDRGRVVTGAWVVASARLLARRRACRDARRAQAERERSRMGRPDPYRRPSPRLPDPGVLTAAQWDAVVGVLVCGETMDDHARRVGATPRAVRQRLVRAARRMGRA